MESSPINCKIHIGLISLIIFFKFDFRYSIMSLNVTLFAEFTQSFY